MAYVVAALLAAFLSWSSTAHSAVGITVSVDGVIGTQPRLAAAAHLLTGEMSAHLPQCVCRTHDCLPLDLRMDGLDATRGIEPCWPDGERPRIVAMAANAMQGVREHCRAARMDHDLTEPIRVEALTKALMRVRPRNVN